jgi:hypothetical protein
MIIQVGGHSPPEVFAWHLVGVNGQPNPDASSAFALIRTRFALWPGREALRAHAGVYDRITSLQITNYQ